jgi:hypothetical protein
MSSEDIQTSKNILTPDYIETAVSKLTAYAYSELYVSVDFAFESEECSFGTDPIDHFFIGDIEIGEDLSLESQYHALIHEVGHAALFIERDENKNIILNEARAWIRGLKIITLLNLVVNEAKFAQDMLGALNFYNKEVKDDN